MAEVSDSNPHLTNGYSPLAKLMATAIRQYGDFSAALLDGDLALMLLEFANQIIDDIRSHPYHDGSELNYYTHPEENREIPDPIVVAGLKAYYALQQQNEAKVSVFLPAYYRTLNSLLWYALNGNTRIKVRPVDVADDTSEINGLEVDDE